ncbi:MAG: sigma-70 family RNA polymerase sigma factor [Candidatus Aminicenantes bacterium]|nr:sigma-70 family RNA polymerase sigma factor [Candidatus Aminicenantes bacterium]
MRDEAELVKRTLDGDESAFEVLLGPYKKGLLNMAYQITLNAEDAKDISQEAVVKAYRHLHKFKKTKSFKNWIYTITAHAAYDFIHKRNRQQDLVHNKQHTGDLISSSPEKQYQNTQTKEKIQFCLKLLTPKEKMVYILRDIKEFSIKETSQTLNISSQSVRTHLSRARKKIRHQFEQFKSNNGETNEV